MTPDDAGRPDGGALRGARRIMGIETEYGVLEPGRPEANPMLLSSHVVGAYASGDRAGLTRTRWDYEAEDPLQDARGFRLERASAHPSMLTDDPNRPAPSGDGPPGEGSARLTLQDVARSAVQEYEDPSALNLILTNGGRLYVDHAHPEYSTPETTGPRDAVVWDKAGEQIMLMSARILAANPALPDVALYKNNVDGKGATYGTHENYLLARRVPFGDVVRGLTAFFVTRTVFTGAGRVGIGPTGQQPGFQLAQRADYIEAEVGLETTLRRPIINTRDEPHADRDRWRRLHVIIGDANLLEVATYLKLGTTACVLWLLENAERAPRAAEILDGLQLRDPVGSVQAVSHDVTLRHELELLDGRRLTALQVQQEYLRAVREGLAEVGEAPDDETADVLARWEQVLDDLAEHPARCVDRVEWLAKLRLLEALRRRDQLAWDHPRLAAVDIQWSDVRPERSLYQRLVTAKAVQRIVTDEEVARAVVEPPRDTRAYFRGQALARYGSEISAASWDSVVFDIPTMTTLRRVPMRDPHRGTAHHVEEVLAVSPDATTLLERLLGGSSS